MEHLRKSDSGSTSDLPQLKKTCPPYYFFENLSLNAPQMAQIKEKNLL
jgi:hypothetical protein